MYIITVGVEGRPAIEFTAIAWRVSSDALHLVEIYHTFVKQDLEQMKKDGFGRRVVHGIPMKTVLRQGLTRSAMKEQLLIFHERYGRCPLFIRENNRFHSLRLKNFYFTQLPEVNAVVATIPDRLNDICHSKNHCKKNKGYQTMFRCSSHKAFIIGSMYATIHGLELCDDLIV